jgi:hypothetical protein
MRILNRPMFRYGGPIKEGIMHGMRNGGRAALVGNPVYPKTGGREHHRINLSWLGLGAKPAAGVASKPGFIRTQAPKAWEKIKSIFGTTTPGKQPGIFEGQILKTPSTSGSFKMHPFFARDPLVKSALWTKGALTGPTAKNIGQKIARGVATPTGIGLTLVGTKWLWPDGKEASQIEIEEHLNTGGGKAGGVPGGGDKGMTYTDPSKAEALAKEARKARLDKYLDTMGYDKANKRALGDALIDASAIVQGDVDEAGSLKKADWGRMINKAIQATSKRLDKPDQIREAVGLMMTKADIAKDLEDPQVKRLRELQIEGAEKKLAGPDLIETIMAYTNKHGVPTGSTLAGIARTSGIDAKVYTGATEWINKNEGKDAIDFIEKEVSIAKEKGSKINPGLFVVKDRIISIDETGKITPVY